MPEHIQEMPNKETNFPLVSVCIPAYNCELHIQKTIRSVLNQSEKRLELVIIDDCSTDDTVIKIKEIDDPRIRLIQNDRNIGFLNNWNKALDEARYTYVKLLSQDDLLDSGCLEQQIKALEHSKEKLAFVSCARAIINDQDRIIFLRSMGSVENGYLAPKDAIKRIVRSGANPVGEPAAVLMRVDIAKKVGHFSQELIYTMDLDYWIRALEHGGLHYINKPLVSYRVHRHSQSVVMAKNQFFEYKKQLEKIMKTHPGLNGLDFYIGCFKSKINAYLRMLFYKIYA